MAATDTTQPMVRVIELFKTYQDEAAEPVRACDDVTLTVRAGEVVALTGASGSGKSTLLHLIGALDSPDAGRIQVAGRDVHTLKGNALAAYRRTIGFVFQRFHLLPTLTAADNVLAPVLPFRVPFNKRRKAHDLLDAVGLTGRRNALPSRLSGGQQQRIAIARALVNDPALLLADEPTGNLDSQTGNDIIALLLSLRERLGTTLLIATHDPHIAATCDRTITMHDGRLVAAGT